MAAQLFWMHGFKARLEEVRHARDEHFCNDSYLKALGFLEGLYWCDCFRSASERYRLDDLVRNAHQVRLHELKLSIRERREERFKAALKTIEPLPLPIVEEEQMEIFE